MTNQPFEAGTSLTPLGDSALLIITKYLEAVRNNWETQDPDPLNVIQIQAENLHYLLSTDRQAIQRVRDLHRPQATSTIDRCAECKKPSPCPTELALNGQQS